MSDLTARFAEIVGDRNLLTGDAIPEDYFHDEVLTTAAAQAGVRRQTGDAQKRFRSC